MRLLIARALRFVGFCLADWAAALDGPYRCAFCNRRTHHKPGTSYPAYCARNECIDKMGRAVEEKIEIGSN